MPGVDPQLIQELVRRARAGEREAFDELYRLHRDWVYGLAWRFTGVEADALDVLQEAFLYLVRKLPELELRARLTTLLYPVVKHLSADARRRRGRFEDGEALLASLEARSETPRELGPLVGSLPEAQREVVLLRFADDFSIEEIAHALGVPEGTVKSRLHHALKSLREAPELRERYGKETEDR